MWPKHYIKNSFVHYYCCNNKTLSYCFQCFPMAFIIELAGGAASNGHKPMLDMVPTGLHVRSPIFLGSKSDVEEVMEMIANNARHKKRHED